MENNKLLSFIIPVYNVEEYLHECVESILCQIDDSCEIILVDDGSTDSSGDICDEYREKSNNIKVIHKENGGPAIARNIGIHCAEGKYIAFVDSDDKIDCKCMTKIIDLLRTKEMDICFMEAIKFYKNGNFESMKDDIKLEYLASKDNLSVLKYLSTRSKFSGSACTKIFKKEFLKKNNLKFPETQECAEDLSFVRDCLISGDNFYVLNIPYYQYRQNVNKSRSNSSSEKLVIGLDRFITESIDVLTQNKKCVNLESKYAMSWVAYEYSIMLLHYGRLDSVRKQRYYCKLREKSWVMRYSISTKIRIIRYMVCALGINITSQLLKIYATYKHKV